MNMYNPAHPGEVLKAYLEGVTVTTAAKKLGVTRVTLSRILNGKAGISAEMALRLSQALNTSADMWLAIQLDYDLWQARQHQPTNVQLMFT
ncbi:addiction module HigA family antidote [Testudinibacter aquarius]|uniref:Addiction module HigA family antidote n=2 Tax=Testudinibacter aquarius TaxID=1524974 RepID=A0A4R3XY25_9PAST|nr:addiction module HigA family antidote [Testudinibacter aquarius]